MPPKLRTTRTSDKSKRDSEIRQEDAGVDPSDDVPSSTDNRTQQELDPQRVVLLPDVVTEALSRGSLKLIRYPHPRTGSSATFILVKGQPARLFELVFHSTSEGFCSFLCDQSVEKDGRLVTATPFDARFLVLDKLREADKFVEVANYFEGDMIGVVDGLKLEAIADTKEVCGRHLAKYNEERVLKWLEAKVRRLAKMLQQKAIACGAIAKSKLLRDETVEAEARADEDYVCSSVEIVREYIADSLGILLERRLGIDRKRSLKERNTDAGEQSSPNPKRRKIEEPTEDYTKCATPADEKKATPKLTLAQKKLASCDKTGMKSITSFFGKKKS